MSDKDNNGKFWAMADDKAAIYLPRVAKDFDSIDIRMFPCISAAKGCPDCNNYFFFDWVFHPSWGADDAERHLRHNLRRLTRAVVLCKHDAPKSFPPKPKGKRIEVEFVKPKPLDSQP